MCPTTVQRHTKNSNKVMFLVLYFCWPVCVGCNITRGQANFKKGQISESMALLLYPNYSFNFQYSVKGTVWKTTEIPQHYSKRSRCRPLDTNTLNKTKRQQLWQRGVTYVAFGPKRAGVASQRSSRWSPGPAWGTERTAACVWASWFFSYSHGTIRTRRLSRPNGETAITTVTDWHRWI